MRAILNDDIIVRWSMRDGVEVGNISENKKNVGLERLRFDGEKVVDLADLTEMWVRKLPSGVFELHAVRVDNSQKVSMTYDQRKYLKSNSSKIRLKTQEEVDNDNTKNAKLALDATLKRSLGDRGDLQIKTLVLLCSLIVYARQQPEPLSVFFDDIIPDIKDAFPLSRWGKILRASVKELKKFLDEYYRGIDELESR